MISLNSDKLLAFNMTSTKFNINKASQAPFQMKTAVVIVTIYALQTILTLFETSVYTFIQSSADFTVSLPSLCSFVIGRSFPTSSPFRDSLVILTIIYLICIFATNLKSNLRHFIKRNADIQTKTFYKNVFTIHFYCLFLPIHNFLFNAFIQDVPPETTSKWIFIVIIALAWFINMLLCVFYFYEALITTPRDPLAISHDYFLKFSWLIRALMGLINTLVIYNKTIYIPAIAINLVNLFLIIMYSFLLFYTLPFLAKKILWIILIEAGAISLLVVANIALTIGDFDKNYNTKYVAVILVAILLPGYLQLVSNWLNKNIEKNFSAVIGYLSNGRKRIRLNKFWLIQKIQRLKPILECTLSEEPLYNYPKMSLQKFGLNRHIANLDLADSHNLENYEQNNIISLIMTGWLQIYPRDSLVRLMLAEFMVEELDLIHEPYLLLSEILAQNTTNRIIKLRAQEIQENIQSSLFKKDLLRTGTMDLNLYFSGFQTQLNLNSMVVSHIKENVNFYHSLQENDPDLFKIMSSGKKSQVQSDEIRVFWKTIPPELQESNLGLLLLYGVYQIYVNFEYQEGRLLLEEYDKIMRKSLHLKNVYEINKDTLCSRSNALILVSSEKHSLGNIMYCNKSVNTIFGQDQKNLLGKNVKVLMPSFFQEIHDQLLLNKLQNSERLLQARKYSSFAVDVNGYVIPVNILVTVYPWINRGFYFAGLIRKIETKQNYILLDPQGNINAYSKRLLSRLSLPPPSVVQKVQISQICKAYKKFTKNKQNVSKTSIFEAKDFMLNKSSTDKEQNVDQVEHYFLPKKGELTSDVVIENELINFNPYVLPESKPISSKRADSQKNKKLQKQATREVHGTVSRSNSLFSHLSQSVIKKSVPFNCSLDVRKFADKKLKILILNDYQPSNEEKTLKPTPIKDVSDIEEMYSHNTENPKIIDPSPSETSFGDLEEFDTATPAICVNRELTKDTLQNKSLFKLELRPSYPETTSFRLATFQQNDTVLSTNMNLMQRESERERMITSARKRDNLDDEENEDTHRPYLHTNTNEHPAFKSEPKGRDHLERKKSDSLKSVDNHHHTRSLTASVAKKSPKENTTTIKQMVVELSFYKFSKLKIPFIWLLISLFVLLLASLFVNHIGTSTIPIIQQNFVGLQGNLNRIIYLSEINYLLISMMFYISNINVFKSSYLIYQTNLTTISQQLMASNAQQIQMIDFYSVDLRNSIYEKDVKMYMDDVTNRTSTTNNMLVDSLQALNLIELHVAKIAHTAISTNNTASLRSDMIFVMSNVFTSLLAKLQREPKFIKQEIEKQTNQAQTTSSPVSYITLAFIGLTIILLVFTFVNSYIETRRFLEYFIYFRPDAVAEIISEMNFLKEAINSATLDKAEFTYSGRKNIEADIKNDKIERKKASKTSILMLAVYKRLPLMISLLLIPFVIVIVSQQIFADSFANISPALLNIIKPKEIITTTILTLAELGYYSSNLNYGINGQNTSTVIAKNIADLDQLISEASSLNHNFDLLHQDFCPFVTSKDYNNCKLLFNGVSSTGLFGTITTISTFLKFWKGAIDTNDAVKVAWAISSGSIRNSFTLTTIADEAVNYVEQERIHELTGDFQLIKRTSTIFIVSSSVVSVIILVLGAFYVYLPAMRFRKDVCQLISLVPLSLIMSNQRLKLYLVKNSPMFKSMKKLANSRL